MNITNATMTREIKIIPVLNGFICFIGCQQVVFNSREELIRNLEQYYACPDGVEAMFVKMAVNPMSPVPCAPAANPNYVDSPSGAFRMETTGGVCTGGPLAASL